MKHEICPECEAKWTWNEIGYQLCNNCGYENSNEAAKIQIKRIARIIMKYLIACAISVFVGVFFWEGYDIELSFLVASFTKVVVLIIFIVHHFNKIKKYNNHETSDLNS